MDLSRIINPPEDKEVSPSPDPLSPIPYFSRPISPIDETTEETSEVDEDLPNVSFIVAMEAIGEGNVSYVSPTAYHLMGWDPDEVVGTPAALYAHPDDAPALYHAYQEMISEDKAACLMYHRIPFKDRSKGHLLCRVTISRAGPHLIGACAPATSATKDMHDASTAHETIFVTPSAHRLAFRRWNVPSIPTYSSSEYSTSSRETTPSHDGSAGTESSIKDEADELAQSIHHLTLSPPSKPEIAKRVAFVLDRFSKDVPIIYSTNDDILPRSLITGRSFFDFVTPADETRMRQAINMVKGWGVNEEGSPSDGGFAFNRFHMYLRGRDSSSRPDVSVRKRRSLHAMAPVTGTELPDSTVSRNRSRHRTTSERGVNAPAKDVMLVDSIFSPQSDGIIVILRMALLTGVMP